MDFSVFGMRYRRSESNHAKPVGSKSDGRRQGRDFRGELRFSGSPVPPPLRRANQSEGYDAKPEVDRQAEVNLE
jgi:hypothetical protein